VRKIFNGAKWIERVEHGPGPDQRHQRIGQHRHGHERQEEASEARAGRLHAMRAALDRKEQGEGREPLERSERPHDARSKRQAEAGA
jgi:hypothetical protein